MLETSGNPYDFRSPVRSRALLAGRSEELRQIDSNLRASAAGRPRHFSILGPPAAGKSSLVTGVASIAAERGLLAVVVPLREAVVESTVRFYAEVFDRALTELVSLGEVERDGELMRGWVRQSNSGDTTVSLAEQPLEIGLAAAASAQGTLIRDVPISSLSRDVATLVDLCERKEVKGIVLCLDSAEYLDDNRDLPPSLMELADSSGLLTLVPACKKPGALQAVSPRAWAQIEAGPFADADGVLDAIVRPLGSGDGGLVLDPLVATEIHSLTGGRPYEVNLVCHFIWDAIRRGEQADFKLSQDVLQRVLSEFAEKGRYEHSPEIALIESMRSDDFKTAAGVAAYENLTTQEIALVRLMLDDYSDEDFTEELDRVRSDLELLQDLGILDLEDDRFKLKGGADARLYLKYATRARIDKTIHFGADYQALIGSHYRVELVRALFGEDQAQEALLFGQSVGAEFGVTAPPPWVDKIVTAAEEMDLDLLSRSLPWPAGSSAEHLAAFVEHGGLVFGVCLNVGLLQMEHAEVAVNIGGLDSDEAVGKLATWFEENEERLQKYRADLQDVRATVISPSDAKTVAAYADLQGRGERAVLLFQAGHAEAARSELQDSIDRSEALIGSSSTDPRLRTKLAEAYNRLAFVKTSLGDTESAEKCLDRYEELSAESDYFVPLNRAFLRASEGQAREAADLADEAAASLGEPTDDEPGVFLHAWFPGLDVEASGGAGRCLVTVRGPWVFQLVKLQAAVYRASIDEEAKEGLIAQLDGISSSAPAGVLRLAGWAERDICQRPDRADQFFESALECTPLEELSSVRADLEEPPRPPTLFPMSGGVAADAEAEST